MTMFRILTMLSLFAVAWACTPVGTHSLPTPMQGSPALEADRPSSRPRDIEAATPSTPPGDGSEVAAAVVKTALDAIGTPYEWGGTDENGFDCSGLIQYSYARYGIALPRVSRDQLRLGTSVPLDAEALRPGDVLGFSQEVGGTVGGTASHVGLYLGEGRFLHSSSSGVRLSDIRESYWQRHLVAARRMVRGP
jgi:cell wall-associated NlpC family hydrolase